MFYLYKKIYHSLIINHWVKILTSLMLCVILLCALFLLTTTTHDNSIDCYFYIDSMSNGNVFSGTLNLNIHGSAGEIFAVGKLIDKNNISYTVNRRAEFSVTKKESFSVLKNTDTIKYEKNNIPPELMENLLPMFLVTPGGSSIYKFSRQYNGDYVMFRGSFPVAYCER